MNKRYTMKVHKGGQTLVLTLANHEVAWTTYGSMPKAVSCDLPEAERHAVFSHAETAIEAVENFFSL